MATVMLCAEEPILAEGLRQTLNNVAELELVDYCPLLADLHEQVRIIQPDILLLEMTPEVTFSVLSSLRRAIPSLRVVVWVHAISVELALQAMTLGVRGILRTTMPLETLVRCLTRVSEGELWFEKGLTDAIMTARSYSLTPRQSQLVSLLTQGLKNKEIATALNISEGTVKVYMSRMFQKLEVKDRFELALYGLRNLTPGSRVSALTTAPTNVNAYRSPWLQHRNCS
jgi:two-component system, NarL family, nitrate/nitrite response regulator NarL